MECRKPHTVYIIIIIENNAYRGIHLVLKQELNVIEVKLFSVAVAAFQHLHGNQSMTLAYDVELKNFACLSIHHCLLAVLKVMGQLK